MTQQYNKAAVTIQAAYRGHTVRQALTPEKPADVRAKYDYVSMSWTGQTLHWVW